MRRPRRSGLSIPISDRRGALLPGLREAVLVYIDLCTTYARLMRGLCIASNISGNVVHLRNPAFNQTSLVRCSAMRRSASRIPIEAPTASGSTWPKRCSRI